MTTDYAKYFPANEPPVQMGPNVCSVCRLPIDNHGLRRWPEFIICPIYPKDAVGSQISYDASDSG